MKDLLTTSLLLCCFSFGFTQDKISQELLPDLEWGEGSIMLNDGTEKKGLIKYNDKEGGLVSYDQGAESHSYTARSILGFEFFDERLNRQRVFYTLEYEDDQTVGKRPMFFEVLKDLKTFAVIKDRPDSDKANSKRANRVFHQSYGNYCRG